MSNDTKKQVKTASEGAGGNAAVNVTPSTAPAPRFAVSLKCPTPLAQSEMVVEAASESEAKQKFMDANGISGSAHEWSVQKVTEQMVAEQKVTEQKAT